MKLDLTLVYEKPTTIIETSIDADKSYIEAWEWSNRLCLNLMRMTMVENIKPSMSNTNNKKEFMLKVKEYSELGITNKAIVGTLMSVSWWLRNLIGYIPFIIM